MLAGRSIIAGMHARVSPDPALVFMGYRPAEGSASDERFQSADRAEVDRACCAAGEAFSEYRQMPGAIRGAFLRAIARGIERLDETLIERVRLETGYTAERVRPERDRTVRTLRMFADLVTSDAWRQVSIEEAEPMRVPVGRPELARRLVPLGPVAVFGASNFPLAYSVAGGDTASALAAGCPVVVKGHPSHPGTGEMVAKIVAEAAAESGVPSGVFSFLHAGGERERAIGEELVTHAAIRAGGFTGSLGGGMSLARLAHGRSDGPIPFFAEMGSVNPVFVFAGAMEKDGKPIADALAKSIGMAAGQQCTCPGLIFVPRGELAERFVEWLVAGLAGMPRHPLLTERIDAEFERSCGRARALSGVGERLAIGADGVRRAVVFDADEESFRRHQTLREECFGPSCVVVRCEGTKAYPSLAGLIRGSLTASYWHTNEDTQGVLELVPALESIAGRIIGNGVPTGVEVSASMVHSGPYPACNRPESTAVGAMAIQRWCRPVCYQNVPERVRGW